MSCEARKVCQEERDGMRTGRKRLRSTALLRPLASLLTFGRVGQEAIKRPDSLQYRQTPELNPLCLSEGVSLARPKCIDFSLVGRTRNGVTGTG